MMNQTDCRMQNKKTLIVVLLVCGLLVLVFVCPSGPRFSSRWHRLRDGMTEAEVRNLLGSPTQIGKSGCIGAGGKAVIRWDYWRSVPGRSVHYYVDFDYTGPRGAPEVFRTECRREKWMRPEWWPWQPVKARA